MSEGIDFGLDVYVNFDARGIPEPPRWLTEMIDAGKLTLYAFDDDYELGLDVRKHDLSVVIRSTTQAVSFFVGPISLQQIAAMTRGLVSRGALADAKPLPSDDMDEVKALGDFQAFYFHPTEDGVGTCLYTRAVDQRNAVRLVFRTPEAVARLAVSLRAATEVVVVPKLERLNVPYTVICETKKDMSPEDVSGALRPVKSASGKVSGMARVGDGLSDMVPAHILAPFDDNGVRLPTASPTYAFHPVTWYVIVALVAAAVATTLARVVF